MRYTAVSLVVLLAGCGTLGALSGEDSGPEFSASADILGAFNKAGLACSGYQAVPKEDRDWAAQGAAVDVGTCELESENIDLLIFKDKGQRDNWAGISKQMGCTMGKAFGVTNFNYVIGDNWAVSGTSQTLANQIDDAIGGRAVHVDCEDVEFPPS